MQRLSYLSGYTSSYLPVPNPNGPPHPIFPKDDLNTVQTEIRQAQLGGHAWAALQQALGSYEDECNKIEIEMKQEVYDASGADPPVNIILLCFNTGSADRILVGCARHT